MKKLLKQIKKWQDADIEDDWFAKMLFEPSAGDKIEIYWVDRESPDIGYIFTLPEQELDILDCCVHVPQMDNSDGIGNGEEIHLHLMEILSNKRVEQVVKFTPSVLCECREDDKHGETTIWCCNHCGLPTEKFWNNKPISSSNDNSLKFELSAPIDWNSPEMKAAIKLVKEDINTIMEAAKVDTTKLHITFR